MVLILRHRGWGKGGHKEEASQTPGKVLHAPADIAEVPVLGIGGICWPTTHPFLWK